MIRSILTAFVFVLLTMLYTQNTHAQQTYAEKLGYPKGAKVIIMHVDDVGMSHDSNMGAIKAITKGVATSGSLMMPCSWVPEFAKYYQNHPGLDIGIHVTLTSEWDNYRWSPVAGREAVPSLLDSDGYFYSSVAGVAQHADPRDVQKEIQAQIDLARNMGFHLSHLDTHMGTVYATPSFLKVYVQEGIKNHIPVMLPGGKDELLKQSMPKEPDSMFVQLQHIGQQLWNAGLPVLDDLHNLSYDWKVPDSIKSSDQKLQQWRTQKYIDSFKKLRPGITLVINHSTDPSQNFSSISDSGPLRKSDMLAMLDPRFKEYLDEQGIILTTWTELQNRRDQLNKTN